MARIKQKGKVIPVVLMFVVAGVLIAGYFLSQRDGNSFLWHSPESKNVEERRKAATKALAKGAAEKEIWPASPEALIREFWEAAHNKDYDKLLVLCPGSVKSDFVTYYDKWTPSPAKTIGKPEAHPIVKGVVLYPTAVSFPGYPNKTIKMAVARSNDGRLIIDGKNSIWW